MPRDLPPRPAPHPPWALSPWLCCIGGFPWCSTTPSPTPGLQGVISEAPAHSSRQTSGVCPGPWATGQPPPPQTPHMHARPGAAPPWGGHLADSQIPPISYKLASLWLRVKLLPQPHPQRCQLFCAALSFLPKDPLVPHPQRPALGGSSLLPSPCLQHPVLCLPVLTMEGIGYETKSQTRYMQYLFV